jgi:hypothetical protein
VGKIILHRHISRCSTKERQFSRPPSKLARSEQGIAEEFFEKYGKSKLIVKILSLPPWKFEKLIFHLNITLSI